MTNPYENAPEIQVDGKQPDWLKDGRECQPFSSTLGWELPYISHACDWPNITAIKLPDHTWGPAFRGMKGLDLTGIPCLFKASQGLWRFETDVNGKSRTCQYRLLADHPLYKSGKLRLVEPPKSDLYTLCREAEKAGTLDSRITLEPEPDPLQLAIGDEAYSIIAHGDEDHREWLQMKCGELAQVAIRMTREHDANRKGEE